jgi:hypothetical protein
MYSWGRFGLGVATLGVSGDYIGDQERAQDGTGSGVT